MDRELHSTYTRAWSRSPSQLNETLTAEGSPLPSNRLQAADDHHVVAAKLKIISHPGHYMNHEAQHLVDARSVEYWASLPGHTRDQVFCFQLEHAHVLAAVEWKDRGDDMGVAKLALEAKVGESWQKLATWDAIQKSDWQAYMMSMSLRSQFWRLTFVCNHGDENHLVVQSVRFIIKLPPTSPTHNVMHAQRITKQLWNSRAFSDVEVVCGERHFPAHRAVLSAASPVFAAMLQNEMKETKVGQIHLEDTDERSVRDTLEYIYTGCVGSSAGIGMVVLGHKYDIPGLVEYAAPVALGNLTVDNIIDELRTLRAYSDDKQLGPVFEALENKVHEDPELFKSVMRGV